jgi:hypothetical protein
MRPLVFGAELVPTASVGDRVSREGGRHVGPTHLERIARHDPDERHTGGHQSREAVDVVLDHDVGPRTVDDLAQLRLAVLGAVDQGLPRRLDERPELLDRGLAELRRRVADEVDPELAGVRFDTVGVAFGRRGEVDQVLLEAQRLELALPRTFGGEYDAVASLAEDVADADAVVGRSVRALRHEQERARGVHASLSVCVVRGLAWYALTL